MHGVGFLRRHHNEFIASSKLLIAASRCYSALPTPKKKSEWWVLDGEMHEIGDDVPSRERFHIPRDNIPNKKRKQMREQFMRRTRLVLKDSENESWCKRYIELFQELRSDWEKLYWDKGYSKKVAQEHALRDSEEEDDLNFSPNRRRPFPAEPMKRRLAGYNQLDSNRGKMGYLQDKVEYDQEKRLRQRVNAGVKLETLASLSYLLIKHFSSNRYSSKLLLQ